MRTTRRSPPSPGGGAPTKARLIPTNGRPPKQLKQPSKEISGAAFSTQTADLRRRLGWKRSEENRGLVIWIWDLGTEETAQVGTGPPSIRMDMAGGGVPFAPDGRHVYTNTMSGLTQWDVSTESVRTIAEGETSFSISPDGQRIYVAGSSLTHWRSDRGLRPVQWQLDHN